MYLKSSISKLNSVTYINNDLYFLFFKIFSVQVCKKATLEEVYNFKKQILKLYTVLEYMYIACI